MADWLWYYACEAPRWVRRLHCWIWGHSPMRDMCNRPEHDLCAKCQKLMPGAWDVVKGDPTIIYLSDKAYRNALRMIEEDE